jgi:hypothetical protein
MHPEKQRVAEMLEQLDAYLERSSEAASSSMPQTYVVAEAEIESDRADQLYRYGIPLANPHGLERWRREAEAKRKWEKTMTDAQQARQWQQWVDGRIAAALEEDDGKRARALADLIGEALASERIEQRKRVREEIRTAVAELRAELGGTKLSPQNTRAEGAIIDLPSFPTPRKRDPHAA